MDTEWDYLHHNITRNELPPFIYKLYEMFLKTPNQEMRILFNTLYKNSSIMNFNLSGLDINKNFSDIELHFYNIVEERLLQKPLILRLYQIEDNSSNDLINPDTHKLLNVIYSLQADSGWQVCIQKFSTRLFFIFLLICGKLGNKRSLLLAKPIGFT